MIPKEMKYNLHYGDVNPKLPVIWAMSTDKDQTPCSFVRFISKHDLVLRYMLIRHASRKQDYSNILKILPPKNENFQIKKSDIFHISAQNIDWGYSLEPPRWGGSNEYPQSMFLSRNKKNNVNPFKSQFYYTKVGFKGVNII